MVSILSEDTSGWLDFESSRKQSLVSWAWQLKLMRQVLKVVDEAMIVILPGQVGWFMRRY